MIKITYIGQMTYLIECGGLRIVTDPYLSTTADRPGCGRNYPPLTDLAGLSPDIILISHPHCDHLDPATLAPYYRLRRRTFTLVPAPSVGSIEALGGEAVGLKAGGSGRFGEPFVLGDTTVKAIPCAHTELHRTADGDFVELSYLIESEGKRIFFGGDMSMYEGLLEALTEAKPDVMLLPVNGADWFRTSRDLIGNIDSNEAAELAVRVGAHMYIPGHHDLYEFNGCPNDVIEISAKRFSAPLKLLAPGESVDF